MKGFKTTAQDLLRVINGCKCTGIQVGLEKDSPGRVGGWVGRKRSEKGPQSRTGAWRPLPCHLVPSETFRAG